MLEAGFTSFISADWSKDPKKRSVHVVDLPRRRIWREARAGWDLKGLLELARGFSQPGSTLVGLDLALGVPAGYWSAVREDPRWRGAGSFLDWLRTIDPSSDLFEPVKSHAEWSVDRPFFRVPKGRGSLLAFEARVEGGLRRRIDRVTGAKPIFAASGIPGTVGSGTLSLWRELIPVLTEDRDFAVWPFDGELGELPRSRRIVLAETYPALAYAAALAEELPSHPLRVAKTQREAREPTCRLLEQAGWVKEGGVDLGDLEAARADEDAFDSLLVAAGVLRCEVEGRALCDPAWADEVAEGGMLLAGPVDPSRRAKRLRLDASPGPRFRRERSEAVRGAG